MRKRAERFGVTSLVDAPVAETSTTTTNGAASSQTRNPRQKQKQAQPQKPAATSAPEVPLDPVEEEKKRKRLERFGPVAAPVSLLHNGEIAGTLFRILISDNNV